MGRWTMVALGTTVLLLVIAGAQRTSWITQQIGRTGIFGMKTGVVGGAGLAALQPPFAAQSPAWSQADKLVGQLQDALKQRPEDPLTPVRYAQLGSLYLQKARETGDPAYYAKAEGVLQQSLAASPDNPLAMLGMGSVALSRHDFAGALDWGRRVLERAPNSYVAYEVMADAYTELGQYPAAVDALQKAVDLRPDQSTLSRVSYARELHGDIPHAVEAMQQAIDAGAPRAEGTNWSRVQLGNLYFNSGNLDGAEEQYRATLYFLPDYVHGLAGLAKVAAARGDLARAAGLYTQALNTMPWPEYATALGDVYRAMGNEPAAKQADGLVRAMTQLQRASGVDVDLELALFEADHAPDAASAAAALQAAQAAYARRPDSVHAQDVLAWALYRAGKPAEALDLARQSLRLGSRDPLQLFHAGAIAAAAGQPDEARQDLEAALGMNAHFSVRYAPEAKRLLDHLAKAGA